MKANCMICGDLFDEVKTIVSAPCGHTFHDECLRHWLVESPTCPSCRKCVLLKNIIHLYFNVIEEDSNPESLLNENTALKAKLCHQDIEAKKLQNVIEGLREFVHAAEADIEKLKAKHSDALDQVNSQKEQMKQMSKQVALLETLREQNAGLKMQLKHLQNMNTIIDGTVQEVEEMLKTCGEGPGSAKQMATYCAILKRELFSVNESRNLLRTEVACLKRELGCKTSSLAEKTSQLAVSKQEIAFLNETLIQLEKEREPMELKSGETGSRSMSQFPVRSTCLTPKLSNPEKECEFQSLVTPEAFKVTPMKKLKVNMVSSFITKLQKTEEDTPLCSVPHHKATHSLFKLPPTLQSVDDSVIRRGYNGLGGHTQFVNTTPKISGSHKTKTRKQTASKENVKHNGPSSNVIPSFFS